MSVFFPFIACFYDQLQVVSTTCEPFCVILLENFILFLSETGTCSEIYVNDLRLTLRCPYCFKAVNFFCKRSLTVTNVRFFYALLLKHFVISRNSGISKNVLCYNTLGIHIP